eukprot:Polyplicarium_translucidae@DN3341_c0_g2_i1.p1
MAFQLPPLGQISKIIADEEQPITARMRALFGARHHGGDEAVKALAGGLSHKSVLLRHEIAYVMGQMGEKSAIPTLERLLEDVGEHAMVRHEAAEALAAIGDPSSERIVSRFVSDKSIPVRETCALAVESFRQKRALAKPSELPEVSHYLYSIKKGPDSEMAKFPTVDPIAGESMTKDHDMSGWRSILLDQKADLPKRYAALFSLRNSDHPTAGKILAEALEADASSALFRHEVAFVLGQLQDPTTASALIGVLSATDEHPMSRHECALALGSVAEVQGVEARERRNAVDALRTFSKDPEQVVAESCLVALDNLSCA